MKAIGSSFRTTVVRDPLRPEPREVVLGAATGARMLTAMGAERIARAGREGRRALGLRFGALPLDGLAILLDLFCRLSQLNRLQIFNNSRPCWVGPQLRL